MSVTRRLLDLARANLTDFREAFTRDSLRSTLDHEPDTVDPTAGDSVGGRAGRRARVMRDAAEEAWERAYEEARTRTGVDPGGVGHELERRKWYRTLELEPGATADDVRKAYRRLLKQYHPDRHTSDPAKYAAATELTRRLTAAYDGLMADLGAA
jgi:DnaJ-domain-containing protein 1